VPGAFLDDAARTAFAGAIAATESTSAAEVVVAVRVRARTWIHVHFLVGLVAAWLGLGFMLYSDHRFGLAQFLVDPLVVGVLAGFASTLSAPLVRALTPAVYRRRAVTTAARAAFYERGVHHTTGRSGILLYIALTEQMAELVADDGVVRSVEPDGWKKACAAIDRAVARGGEATAKALAELGPMLALALPRDAEDVNELPDAIDDGGAP
jgi:putative membrane protein